MLHYLNAIVKIKTHMKEYSSKITQVSLTKIFVKIFTFQSR